MHMKTARVVFAVLFVILMPLVLLLTDVQLVAYDRDYYRTEYDKYGIPEHIGMSMDVQGKAFQEPTKEVCPSWHCNFGGRYCSGYSANNTDEN